MSYSTAKPYYPWTSGKQQWPFAMWYIDNCQNIDLPEGASPYLRNARIEWSSIKIRPWHTLFTQLTQWTHPRGVWVYSRSSADNDKLIVRHNQDTNKKIVLIDSDAVVTEIDTSTLITSDNRMTFVSAEDDVYCMNWIDAYGKLSDTTYTNPSTGIVGFSPAFWVVFNGSMWASWWATNPSKVYKSQADDYDDFAGTGTDIFTFQDRITGLSANNEAIFYFTATSISVTGITDIQDTAGTISYFTRALYAKEWSVNHASIIETGNKTFFVTPSNKICTIVRWNSIYGYEIVELSERNNRWISKIMWSLDKNQTDCFWYFLPKENLIKWFFKSNGSTIHDVCIVYDITKDAFLVDGQKFFYDWVFFNWYNYTISMVESKVYIDEYGQDDEDAPISFEYWTKEFYLWDPTTRKTLWETRTLIDMNLLANLTQEIWIDGRQIDIKQMWSINIPEDVNWIWTDPIWEVAIWEATISDDMFEVTILRTKWNLNQKGIKFQLRFKNTSYAWKIRLKSIMGLVETLPLIATQLTK